MPNIVHWWATVELEAVCGVLKNHDIEMKQNTSSQFSPHVVIYNWYISAKPDVCVGNTPGYMTTQMNKT